MSSLISRGAVLTMSRLSNFSIQLLSPLLLVRILDVDTYGQYQEFMVYALLLSALCSFAFDSSLTYFLSRHLDRYRQFVTQSTVITLLTSGFWLSILLLAKPAFLLIATYDFVLPLAAYVFFFVNLNWLEYYWIAKRRADVVLYYSAARLLLRLTVLLLAAVATQDLQVVLWSLVATEAFRCTLALTYTLRRRMLTTDLNRDELIEQIRFATPIGASALAQNSGRSAGKLFIASALGPASLAFYAIGSYLMPVVRMMRSGIEDAVFPELVKARHEPGSALRLWQRVNVLNCAMFFPLFVILIVYSELIVTTLFTSAYLPALPVFQVYAFFLLRRCFNTDTLLRTKGQAGFMLWGTLGALALNLALIPALARPLGLLGPAIAFITSEIALELYYASRMLRHLNIQLPDLADWQGILRIIAACILAAPTFLVIELIPGPDLLRAVLASILFLVATLYVAYRLGVADIGRVTLLALSLVHRR